LTQASAAGRGGLDTAKAVAQALKVPVIVAPTDAPSSALSVIYPAAGDFKRSVFCPANPNVALVDTGLVVRAPVRLCYERLLNYGVLAKPAGGAKVITPALKRVVEANTLLSGLGFERGGAGRGRACGADPLSCTPGLGYSNVTGGLRNRQDTSRGAGHVVRYGPEVTLRCRIP